MSIFLGADPYNNANLKAMANVGSQMFNSMSVIFAYAYNIGNTDRANKMSSLYAGCARCINVADACPCSTDVVVQLTWASNATAS